jgi:4-amino-4-deoxy-L-arabinose transferase-like glycosyltransferase
MRRLAASRRAILLALAVITLAGFALRAHQAANPTTSYQSADERSYGRLAYDLAHRGTYGSGASALKAPLHWPPGAPALFAVAWKLDPDPSTARTGDIPAAYWAQAIVGTGTILAVFALAALIASPLAGLLAAAIVAFYPPLILASGEQLSENLGAFVVALAFAALAWAWTREVPRWPRFALAGALLGAAVLVRADLLLVPFIVAAVVGLLGWLRPGGARRTGLVLAAALAAGALAAMLPWTIYASQRANSFVPVTQGSASALFVGTYLPGKGTTVGMKRALGVYVKQRNPALRDTPDFDLEAGQVLNVVADWHPELPRDSAIRKAARDNLRTYALGDPVAFAGMMVDKAGRMWLRYARGGPRHTSPWIRGWHIALVLASVAGIVLGLRRRPTQAVLWAMLATCLYSTALHMIVVSQGRYNLPLMPALIAAGAAGLVLWRRESVREAPPVLKNRAAAPIT